MENYWEYIPVKHDDIKLISDELHLPIIVARILVNRGYNTPALAEKFINPKIEDLHNPFLFKDMEKAVERTLRAIENKETICIYGDYDVDGVTSIVILKDALERLGGSVIFTIPNRLDEGYGLNSTRLNSIISKQNIGLIITVDTGTTSMNEAEMIRETGIDLIITDHHEEGTERPHCYAMLNPKLSGCEYPFNKLAGVGVIFKFLQGLSERAVKKLPLVSYLKIAALGTVADIVPLVDENRIIASLGLKNISSTNNLGLKTLLSELRLDNQRIEASDISFRLGPQINALGRLGDVEQAVELFFTSNRAFALEIVREMARLNGRRQLKEREIFDKAIEIIENDKNFENNPITIVMGDKWHLGVIGIVASRLTNKFYKPSLVLSLNDGFGKASGRSIPGFDLKGAIDQEADLLESFGGHKMAVGFQITQDNIPAFKERITKRVRSIMDGHLFIKSAKIDADIMLPAINDELMEKLDLLKPCGHSNPKPVFRAKGVTIENKPVLIKDRHIKMRLGYERTSFEAICWKRPEWYETLCQQPIIDIVFHLNKNFWHGSERIQFEVQDLDIASKR